MEKLQFTDPFHIYQKIDEFTKIIIDYKTFEKNLESYSQKIVSNIKIPKNLLLSKLQIVSLILNEIKKVNRNKSYDHYIVPDNINPYILHLFFVFKDINVEMKFTSSLTYYISQKNFYPLDQWTWNMFQKRFYLILVEL